MIAFMCPYIPSKILIPAFLHMFDNIGPIAVTWWRVHNSPHSNIKKFHLLHSIPILLRVVHVEIKHPKLIALCRRWVSHCTPRRPSDLYSISCPLCFHTIFYRPNRIFRFLSFLYALLTVLRIGKLDKW